MILYIDEEEGSRDVGALGGPLNSYRKAINACPKVKLSPSHHVFHVALESWSFTVVSDPVAA